MNTVILTKEQFKNEVEKLDETLHYFYYHTDYFAINDFGGKGIQLCIDKHTTKRLLAKRRNRVDYPYIGFNKRELLEALK